MSPIGKGSSDGFTLAEALVAFVVVALVLQMAFQIISTQHSNLELAHAKQRAATHAANLLASIGTEIPMRQGTLDGSLDRGYRYSVVITPYPINGQEAEDNRLSIFEVDLRITWEDFSKERMFSLRTLRLGVGVDE